MCLKKIVLLILGYYFVSLYHKYLSRLKDIILSLNERENIDVFSGEYDLGENHESV